MHNTIAIARSPGDIAIKSSMTKSLIDFKTINNGASPLKTAIKNVDICFILGSCTSHWIFKECPHEFLAPSKYNWEVHAAVFRDPSWTYRVLGESKKGIKVIEIQNTIGFHFEIDKNYPSTLKMLTNFILKFVKIGYENGTNESILAFSDFSSIPTGFLSEKKLRPNSLNGKNETQVSISSFSRVQNIMNEIVTFDGKYANILKNSRKLELTRVYPVTEELNDSILKHSKKPCIIPESNIKGDEVKAKEQFLKKHLSKFIQNRFSEIESVPKEHKPHNIQKLYDRAAKIFLENNQEKEKSYTDRRIIPPINGKIEKKSDFDSKLISKFNSSQIRFQSHSKGLLSQNYNSIDNIGGEEYNNEIDKRSGHIRESSITYSVDRSGRKLIFSDVKIPNLTNHVKELSPLSGPYVRIFRR